MIEHEVKLPFYAKATILMVGLIALIAIMYVGQSIIMPIVFSVIFSIVLHPVVNFFTRKKVNRILSIVITLFITFLVLALITALLLSQVSRFAESWPILVDRFTTELNDAIKWAAGYFDIRPRKLHDWLAKTQSELIDSSGAVIGQTLVSLGNALVFVLLVPVYIFMILFYHPLIIDFIHKLFGEIHLSKVTSIITQTKNVIQGYLVGLFAEFVIVAVLNCLGLLVLGIDYAIMLGIIGAMLNVIPYLGGLVAVLLFMAFTFVTKEPIYVVYVAMLYSVVQFIDNNYIVPKIVASQVKINALFSIIVVIVGNAIWGVPGMFLSIPMLAIVKLICDHIDPLKPWGFLLGDTMPPIIKIEPIIKKIIPRINQLLKK